MWAQLGLPWKGISSMSLSSGHWGTVWTLLIWKSEVLWNLLVLVCAAAAKSLQLCPTLRPHRRQPTRLPRPLGFSRQEHWSGLPFPSPMHERKSEREFAQSCPTLSDPMDCSLPGSSIHGIFQARVLEWGAIAFSECLCVTGGKCVKWVALWRRSCTLEAQYILFYYLLLAALGLPCCVWASSGCAEQRLLFVVVCGLLFQRLHLLQSTSSRHAGFRSCGTWA